MEYLDLFLNTGADVFYFDYSNAIEANKINNGNKANLHLFQGVYLRYSSSDRVVRETNLSPCSTTNP